MFLNTVTFPSQVTFPQEVGRPINLNTLTQIADFVAPHIQRGQESYETLRTILNGLFIPRDLHAQAIREFAIGLSFKRDMSLQKAQELVDAFEQATQELFFSLRPVGFTLSQPTSPWPSFAIIMGGLSPFPSPIKKYRDQIECEAVHKQVKDLKGRVVETTQNLTARDVDTCLNLWGRVAKIPLENPLRSLIVKALIDVTIVMIQRRIDLFGTQHVATLRVYAETLPSREERLTMIEFFHPLFVREFSRELFLLGLPQIWN